MSPHTHRSVIPHQHQDIEPVSSPPDPDTTGYVVVMDDREEEKELISLLILREDRRGGFPGFASRGPGKGEAA
jgi:hypothetical protein